ncbi:DUF2147 domain-containing protein [Leptospira ognonensis]|uniref:DUF2147 domain-containing protein n=1 Tax=Leptospira ognonensis TaxID=2484945 RepID=A0A4R9K6N4_9LEPT|nr:DUF2147 domain-containing protein [Leptospira ognonensis]TGL60298.1 DUF2147 domain-containing protein [Leptospira ognonensis]
MNLKHVFSIGLFAFGLSTSVSAQEADVAVGRYLPPEKDSVIEIFKCGEKYCGKTVCIKDNAYQEKEKDKGVVGTPYLDHNNEDPRLRTRPNLGMVFISGFDYVGEGVYKNGRIYNPRDGKTYCGKFTSLDGGNKLDLKGTLCSLSFIGKTNSWVKLSGVNLDEPKWDCTFKTKK